MTTISEQEENLTMSDELHVKRHAEGKENEQHMRERLAISMIQLMQHCLSILTRKTGLQVYFLRSETCFHRHRWLKRTSRVRPNQCPRGKYVIALPVLRILHRNSIHHGFNRYSCRNSSHGNGACKRRRASNLLVITEQEC